MISSIDMKIWTHLKKLHIVTSQIRLTYSIIFFSHYNIELSHWFPRILRVFADQSIVVSIDYTI